MSSGVVDWSGLQTLGKGLAGGLEESRRQSMAELMGAKIQTGDYAGAAKTAFDAGDLQTGLSLVKLGDSKAQSADFQKQFGGGIAGIYGGTGTPEQVQQVAPAQPARAPSFTGGDAASAGYLATLRGKESGGNASAKNPNSSATGIDQFTAGTWAGLAKKYPDLGLTPDGRTDPAQSARAMERFTQDNAKALSAAGVPITPGNLYVSHFLGEAGGPRFVRGALANPDAPATAFVTPQAASANRTIFYNRDGSPKTAGAVYAERTSRFGGGAPVQVASADPSFTPQSAVPASTAPRVSPAQEAASLTLPANEDPVAPEARLQVAQAAPQALVQAGMKPAAAAQFQTMQPGSAQRVQWLVRAMAHPAAPEGAKEGMKALLANELQMDRENRQMTPDQKEFAWRTANGYRGTVEDMVAEKRKGADPAIIQEYEYAKSKNGYTGSLLDYTKSKAEAGSTKINNTVNAQGAEGEQDKVVQKDFGDLQVEQRKAAGQAATSLANIRAARQIMRDPTFYSGTFGTMATEGKKALASLGITAPDSARANEGFTKISAQSILDKAGGSFGGAFSNGDRDAIKQTAQNIDNTPAGNALILDMSERVAMRAQENHRQMIAYKAAHKGRIDDGFLTQIDKYSQDNPLFAGLDIPGPKSEPPPASGDAPKGQRDAALKAAPSSEISLARAAIASGVPQAKVLEKMRARGFDPSGL